MRPTNPKATWLVWSSPDIQGSMNSIRATSWAWVAHGPYGSDTGLEEKAEVAAQKARMAAAVLDDASRWPKEGTP